MAREGHDVCTHALSAGSRILLRCLTDPSLDQVTWAHPVSRILSRIQQIYDIFNDVETLPERALALGRKLAELDRYMQLDIGRQVASYNFHIPYYLTKIGRILDKAVEDVARVSKRTSKSHMTIERSKAANEMLELLWADLEGAFIEYGFCSPIENLHDIDEVTYRLESLEITVSDISRDLASQDREKSLSSLQDLVAKFDGMKLSLSSHAQRVLKNRNTDLYDKICVIEHKMSPTLSDTAVSLKSYLNHQKRLNESIFKVIEYDSFDCSINSHSMHPNTREWVIRKYRQFKLHNKRRIFFLTSQEGYGKSTIASAICKLDFSNIIANHFFGGSVNRLAGLVQSISAGLARTIPEYTLHLEDVFCKTDYFDILNQSWYVQYDVLIRKPMDKLYTSSSGRSRDPPINKETRTIVIDGMGRCLEQDYVRTFLIDFLKDFPPWMRLVVTINATHLYNVALPDFGDLVETLKIDEKPWMGMHIKDVETYMATAISALLQDASENILFSNRARSDEKTLQNVLEELTKYSCGRFDYALELIARFAEEMEKTGQFLGSIKKAMQPLRQRHGRLFDELLTEFSSAFRSYRDREGRDILVSPVSASHSLHLLSLTRIAKLRSLHTSSAQ